MSTVADVAICCGYNSAVATVAGVAEAKSSSELRASSMVDLLNGSQNPLVWGMDTNNINNGYPIFLWQLTNSNQFPTSLSVNGANNTYKATAEATPGEYNITKYEFYVNNVLKATVNTSESSATADIDGILFDTDNDVKVIVYTQEGVNGTKTINVNKLYIYTKADMESFRDKVNGGKTYEGLTVEVKANVDLQGSSSNRWTPIGGGNVAGTSTYQFAGTFEGNNHTISGVYVYTSTFYNGLFGNVNGKSKIQNVDVNGTVNGGGQYTGGIVGYSGGGDVINCTFTGNVTSAPRVSGFTDTMGTGGIIGWINQDTNGMVQKIENCSYNGTLTGYEHVGGIVGNQNGKGTGHTEVLYCHSEGEIKTSGTTGGEAGVAGIVGSCDSIKIFGCYNLATITDSNPHIAAGILGIVWGSHSYNSTIEQCYNAGTINSGFAGGIYGEGLNSISIKNVYNVGIVGKNGTNTVGGGIAIGIDHYSSLQYAYNAGTVRGNEKAGVAVYIGNTSSDPASVNDAYFLTASGLSGYKTKQGTGTVSITSKTSAQLKTTEMVGLLNATQNPLVWGRDDNVNNGYPIFLWQSAGGSTTFYYRVNGSDFVKLQDAISEVPTTGVQTTITVLRDATENSKATIPSTKNIVLDLAGHKITFVSNYNGDAIENNGELEIYTSANGAILEASGNSIVKNKGTGTLAINRENSAYTLALTNHSDETSGRVLRNDAGGQATLNQNATLTNDGNSLDSGDTTLRHVVTNEGILRIDGATIIHEASGDPFEYYVGIYNSGDARIIMTSGTIRTDSYGIYNIGTGSGDNVAVSISGTTSGTSIVTALHSCVYNDAIGEVNVSGGSLRCTTDKAFGIHNHAAGTVNISGGEITSDGYRGVFNFVKGTINVSGGTIKGGTCAVYNSDAGTFNITGGTFIGESTDAGTIRVYKGTANISGSTTKIVYRGIGVSVQTDGTATITEGTIEPDNSGDSIGVGNYGGTVTIGDSENIISTTPTISGTKYGAYATGGTLNIIEGTISGRSGVCASGGTINVNGGTVSGTNCGAYTFASASGETIFSGTINVNGGTISGTNRGAYAYAGTLNIYGGTVSGADYGAYVRSGATLTIGDESDSVSTTTPLIQATSNIGVQVASGGTFNFYDGVIKGKADYAIVGTVADIPNNYYVKRTNEDDIQTAILVEFDELKAMIFDYTLPSGETYPLTVKLPVQSSSSEHNFVVDWGDGQVEQVTGASGQWKSHTYANAGVKTIKIMGSVNGEFGYAYSSNGGTTAVYYINNFDNTHDFRTYLTKVSQLGEIGVSRYGFTLCNSLTSFTSKATADTFANVEGFDWMFHECANLPSVDCGNWNTSNIKSFRSMFAGCINLQTIDVSEWKTENVTTLYNTFGQCYKLASLDVSKWTVDNVTNMSYTFYGCRELTALAVNNWNTSEVDSMPYTFGDCKKLTSIPVDNWNTGKVENMRWMFSNCALLTSIPVGTWNTGSVTNMASMFYNCTNLSSIGVDNWNTSSLESAKNMFCACAVTSLNLKKWDTSEIKDMEGMFNSCNYLKYLDLSTWDTDKVTSMKNMFKNCTAITDVLLGPSFNQLSGESMFDGDTSLKSVISLYNGVMTLSSLENGTTGSLYLTNGVLYVPTQTIEQSYESNTNFTNAFGTDSNAVNKVEPLFNLNGDPAIDVNLGEQYTQSIDRGTLVAGSSDKTELTTSPVFTQFGFSVATTGFPINTNHSGSSTVTYNLTRTADESTTDYGTLTRTIRVADVEAPYGMISIKNKIDMPNGSKGIATSGVSLEILGLDKETGVDKYIIRNENQISDPIQASDWLDFGEDGLKEIENWELSPNDGEKTVYLILKDEAGNTTVSFLP